MSRADWSSQPERVQTLCPEFYPVARVLIIRVNLRLKEENVGLRAYVPRDGALRNQELQDVKVDEGTSKDRNSQHLYGKGLDLTFADLVTNEVYWAPSKGEPWIHPKLRRAFEIFHEEARALGLKVYGFGWDPYHSEVPRDGWVNPLVPGPDEIEPDPAGANVVAESPPPEPEEATETPEPVYTSPIPAESGRKAKPMGREFKCEYHEIPSLLESGVLRKVPYELEVYKHVESGDHMGVATTKDGKKTVTKYLKTLLGKFVETPYHQSDLAKLWHGVTKGALGVLAILNSPYMTVIAKKAKIDLGVAKGVVESLAHKDREDQVAGLIEIFGNDKLRAFKDHAIEIFNDPDATEEDKAKLIEYWG